jgi:hypothetical protein
MDSELIELLAPVIKHWKEKNNFGDEPMDSDDVDNMTLDVGSYIDFMEGNYTEAELLAALKGAL